MLHFIVMWLFCTTNVGTSLHGLAPFYEEAKALDPSQLPQSSGDAIHDGSRGEGGAPMQQ